MGTLTQEVETALLWQVSHGFDLPLVIGEQFICKISGKKFQSASYNDCLQFILTTLYEEGHAFAKEIYSTLISKLDDLQKCKLAFHGFSCETRTYRFHEYKNCFVGKEAVQWLLDNGLCEDKLKAIALGNKWISNQWIAHVTNEQRHFSDSSSHFFRFSNSLSLMKNERMQKGNHGKAMSLILDRDSKELKEIKHLKQQYSKTYHHRYDYSNGSEIKYAAESSFSPQSVQRKRSTTMPTVHYNSNH